jgi:hypothetical protein
MPQGSPGVIAFDNHLHVYYRHNAGDALYRAVYDGEKWDKSIHRI